MKKQRKIKNRLAYSAFYSVMNKYALLRERIMLLGMHSRNKYDQTNPGKVLMSDFFADVENAINEVVVERRRFDDRQIGIAFIRKHIFPTKEYFISWKQRVRR